MLWFCDWFAGGSLHAVMLQDDEKWEHRMAAVGQAASLGQKGRSLKATPQDSQKLCWAQVWGGHGIIMATFMVEGHSSSSKFQKTIQTIFRFMFALLLYEVKIQRRLNTSTLLQCIFLETTLALVLLLLFELRAQTTPNISKPWIH